MLDYRTPASFIEGMRTAILPIGSIEQHGPHLPVGTDTIIADAMARAVATRLDEAWLLPCLPFSLSHEHAGFSGCVSLRTTTLCSVVVDVLDALRNGGIRRTVILNAHGGNHVLRNIVQEWNASHSMRVLLAPTRSAWERARQAAGIASSASDDMHAGEAETSILLHVVPQSVLIRQAEDHTTGERSLLETYGMRHYTSSGVVGFPTRASALKGQVLLTSITDQICDLLAQIQP